MQKVTCSETETTTNSFPQTMDKISSPPNSDEFTTANPTTFSQQTSSPLPQNEPFQVNDEKKLKRAKEKERADNYSQNQDHNCSDDDISPVAPSESPEEDVDDTKSLSASSSHSSKDSGCGKSNSEAGSPCPKIDNSPDLSSTLFWSASLLYHTGIPSPKVKEKHFTLSSSSSLYLSPSPSSSRSKSFFGRRIRSSLSLLSGMDRAGSPQKKHDSLPGAKSPSKDSGAGSSVFTDNSSGFNDKGEGSERKRHTSCESSNSDSKSRTKKATGSLRLFRVARPSLDSFMDKTQSLPRPKRSRPRICEEAAFAAASCATVEHEDPSQSSPKTSQESDEQLEKSATKVKSSSSESSFRLARKALRDSFKSSRNFFPSTSKLGGTAGKSSSGKKEKSDKKSAKADANQQRCTSPDYSEGFSTTDASAPNTPVVIKKSKLEKARKLFASTLSLHTGSSSCGGSSRRYKSASTLVISDSELIPNALDESKMSYSSGRNEISASDERLECGADGEEVLAVVDDSNITRKPSSSSSSSPWKKRGKNKASTSTSPSPVTEGKVESKSAFRFISKSKPKGKDASGGKALAYGGLELTQPPPPGRIPGKGMEIPSDPTGNNPAAAAVEEEKPSKKRSFFLKNIGKTIRSGKVGSSSKEAIKEQSILPTAEIEGARKDKTQEIVILENEPRVRSPKSSRKETILSSGGCSEESTTSSSVAYTPPKRSILKLGSRSPPSSQEKDREIPELEVAETSIDISPQKLSLSGQTSTNEIVGDPVKVHHLDNDRVTKLDHSKAETSPAKKFLPEGESESTQETQVKEGQFAKKKKHNLITSFVLSASSSVKKEADSSSSTMEEGKKKKLGKKMAKKNMNQSKNGQTPTPTPTKSTEEVRLKSGNENNGNIDSPKKETETPVEKSQSDVLSSEKGSSDATAPLQSSRNNYRKSSDASNDLRKNGVHKDAALDGDDEPPQETMQDEKNPQMGLLELKLDSGDEEEAIALSPSSASATATKLNSGDGGGSGSNHSESTKSTIALENAQQGQTNPRKSSSSNTDHEVEISHNGHSNKVNATETVTATSTANPESALPTTLTFFDELRRRQSEVGSQTGEDETDPETACTKSFRQLQPFNYDLEPVPEGKKERLYKVLVVGELGAGKTSIIKRYVHQFFSQHYRATIGVDFALKVLRWDPDTVVRLQLWDIAGQERFGSMTRVYYKEAVGAFVVFDVTRSATLEAVPKWKADLDAKVALPDGRPIPTVLLANKSDQPKEGIAANREKMNEFCQQQGFSAWFETSAKDNINIDESANFLVSKILEMDKWSQEPLAPDPDKLDLTANGKHKGASSSNCAC